MGVEAAVYGQLLVLGVANVPLTDEVCGVACLSQLPWQRGQVHWQAVGLRYTDDVMAEACVDLQCT